MTLVTGIKDEEKPSRVKAFLNNAETLKLTVIIVVLSAIATFGVGLFNHYQHETNCGALGNAPPDNVYALNGNFAIGPGDHFCLGLESFDLTAPTPKEDNAAASREGSKNAPVKTVRQWQWVNALSTKRATQSSPIQTNEKCPETSYTLKIQSYSISGRVDFDVIPPVAGQAKKA